MIQEGVLNQIKIESCSGVAKPILILGERRIDPGDGGPNGVTTVKNEALSRISLVEGVGANHFAKKNKIGFLRILCQTVLCRTSQFRAMPEQERSAVSPDIKRETGVGRSD